MDKKIEDVKKLIEYECRELGFAPEWFFVEHLMEVEKNAKWILVNIQETVDEEVVLLGVYLHDVQRVRGLEIDHQEGGAQEAEKIMKQFNYGQEKINKVKDIISTHSCRDKMPNSMEGRVLATADAMAHYTGDFFLGVALNGDRNLQDYKRWALKKLEVNYNQKVSFDFAREKIKERHKIIRSFISNKNK